MRSAASPGDDDGQSACGTCSQFLSILSPLLALVIHLLDSGLSFLRGGKRLKPFIAARLLLDPAEDSGGRKNLQRAAKHPRFQF